MNRVTLFGRLGRDPETRFTGGGHWAVANFSIATDETYKDRNGEKQKKTEWHKIVAWGKTAEIVQQYLKKGNAVLIEGKLQTREWQDKEGVKRYTTEIVVTPFGLTLVGGNGGRREDAPDHNDDDAPSHGGNSGRAPASTGGTEISDEDIPF